MLKECNNQEQRTKKYILCKEIVSSAEADVLLSLKEIKDKLNEQYQELSKVFIEYDNKMCDVDNILPKTDLAKRSQKKVQRLAKSLYIVINNLELIANEIRAQDVNHLKSKVVQELFAEDNH